MRYIHVEWLGNKPSDAEIVEHLRSVIGSLGMVLSGFRRSEGFLACENNWLDRIRGALALRWQFRSMVSGTKKKLKSRI